MELLFLISLSMLLYTFIGYPAMLKIISFFRRTKEHNASGYRPSASMILSVYNEEEVIAEKIRNFLSLSYPADLLELIIISDGCSDRTEEIIRSFRHERVVLFVQEERGGKTRALNRAAALAKGDILVFTDANSMFEGDAVQKLVQPFADSRVGLVSGRSLYLDSRNSNEEVGGAYRAYEEFMKEQESRVHSIVGADGAIYALRKELYEPLAPEYINDFMHTIQVVLKGYRAVSEPAAVCREVVDETHEGELRRQTRIMAQSWLIYLTQIGRLLARGRLFYAWQLTSHKFLRWMTIPLMLSFFVSTMFLYDRGVGHRLLVYGQLAFVILSIYGRTIKRGLLKIPYMFIMLHIASVLGLFRYLSGQSYTTWSPRNN